MTYRPFTSLLIANRGEIACRIARTARRMGLRVTAVYSEADARAQHVRMADEAHLLGAAPPRESYLNIERIISAAKAAHAEAVHPGYGFLSENADFPQACEDAGLIFVGPPPDAIRAMGAKAAAKALVEKAGVPVVPGYHGEAQDAGILMREARRIGFPVLLKAVAGGGGKGMRVVRRPEEMEAAAAAARREAEAAFGDGALLIEKFVERPRHIEVQVFGDAHGNIVSLFERECTLQRHHQKVIEEAPSAALNEKGREALYHAARKAAAAIGYVGAGTVEFVASDKDAFFIEMNTRLQVEHPVTEMITGLDLVEWQLRAAMGERLPLRQEEIRRHGHAIEARLYAEDAAAGFLPSVGELAHWRMPAEEQGLRIDTGFAEGDQVSQHYDPMLAKIIAHAATREAALARLKGAFGGVEIAGVTTNAGFLARLLGEGAVQRNAIDTGYIERERGGLKGLTDGVDARVLAAACAAILNSEASAVRRDEADPYSPWAQANGWTLSAERRRRIHFRDKQGGSHEAVIIQSRSGMALEACGSRGAFAFEALGARRYSVAFGGASRSVTALFDGGAATVFEGADAIRLTVIEPYAADVIGVEPELGTTAPMPGTILALIAKPGEVLEEGAPMLIMEAMKMEHTLRFPARGRVARYLCAVGDFVAEGGALAEFEAGEGASLGAPESEAAGGAES
jgi:3-methylcrotonyl-CoA carboxylase alpha subunit